jgi:hypothetical protein
MQGFKDLSTNIINPISSILCKPREAKKRDCYKSFIANHLTLLNKTKLAVKSEWRDEISTISKII